MRGRNIAWGSSSVGVEPSLTVGSSGDGRKGRGLLVVPATSLFASWSGWRGGKEITLWLLGCLGFSGVGFEECNIGWNLGISGVGFEDCNIGWNQGGELLVEWPGKMVIGWKV